MIKCSKCGHTCNHSDLLNGYLCPNCNGNPNITTIKLFIVNS